jgi:hypothetical protein
MPEPIDWTTVNAGRPTSPRHYTGATERTGPWKCPACGQPNEGPLDAGCDHCHAGQPGYRAEERQAAASDPVREAFDRFIRQNYGERLDHYVYEIAWAAFTAGLKYVQPAPDVPGDPLLAPVLSGTIESRTIIAALSYFAEQILSMAPDEVKTGEWLDKAGVEQLIRTLETS